MAHYLIQGGYAPEAWAGLVKFPKTARRPFAPHWRALGGDLTPSTTPLAPMTLSCWARSRATSRPRPSPLRWRARGVTGISAPRHS